MKCEDCGASPSDGHTALFRQNPKGEIGRWRCQTCNTAPVAPEVAEIVSIVQSTSRGWSLRGGGQSDTPPRNDR
jgi:hypothetical protein